MNVFEGDFAISPVLNDGVEQARLRIDRMNMDEELERYELLDDVNKYGALSHEEAEQILFTSHAHHLGTFSLRAS